MIFIQSTDRTSIQGLTDFFFFFLNLGYPIRCITSQSSPPGQSCRQLWFSPSLCGAEAVAEREPGLWKASNCRLPSHCPLQKAYERHHPQLSGSSEGRGRPALGAVPAGPAVGATPLLLKVPPKAKLPSCQMLYVHLKNVHKPRIPHLCGPAE